MSLLGDTLLLSRLQFAVTTLYHMIWPTLTVGLSLTLVVLEALWLRTGDEDWYRHLRFWSRLLLLNFSIGVATGLVMEFQFGTNWEPFTQATGGFFGNILGLEGTLAFMLEAGFLGIMMFGWRRVPRGLHMASTAFVALGASLSAFWILVANSWMQTPAGGHFENGRFVVDDFLGALFNSDMISSTTHMWAACIEATAFVVGGISAWYILRKREVRFFLKTLKVAVVLALVTTPLQIYLGDAQGLHIFRTQPEKVGAIESHWRTNLPGTGAAFNILAWPDEKGARNVFEVQVPYLLSLLETRTLTGQVRGLSEYAPADRPPVAVPFFSFRIMVLIGFLLFAVMIWTFIVWLKGRLDPRHIPLQRALLRAWLWSLPLGYIAVETGWLTREEGRQPWVVYRVLRTSDAASTLPPWAVSASLLALVLIYALLTVFFLIYAGRMLRKGPNLTLAPPTRRPE
ncbi:MAG TPA: cytochrome ubiquinol oxidase subunit I [Spirochaetia bacterium]|nr:cytochrome ubiquinol oxidase subunit I [Spirochaetia bacterium]